MKFRKPAKYQVFSSFKFQQLQLEYILNGNLNFES